jgi:hypothetical protein
MSSRLSNHDPRPIQKLPLKVCQKFVAPMYICTYAPF